MQHPTTLKDGAGGLSARCLGPCRAPTDAVPGELMADEPAPPSPAPVPDPELDSDSRRREPWLQRVLGAGLRRTVLLCLAALFLCAIIGIDLVFIVRKARDPHRSETLVVQPAPSSPDAGSAASAPFMDAPPEASANPAPSATDSAPLAEGAGLDFEDETDDGEPTEERQAPSKHYSTVRQAAAESCTTASVDGLSRQIIAQARCTRQHAFVPLPARPNLIVPSNVYPYLEYEAQSRLLRALDARPHVKMKINSALRTVAQQYLVWRWSAKKRCGVTLATPPGESNHEVGLAIDIADPGSWRPALEAQSFRWLGASDRVHFDYKRASGAGRMAPDVLAFQTLWNRNHPKDLLAADGHYNSATERRLEQSPPTGFALGPSCGGAAPN